MHTQNIKFVKTLIAFVMVSLLVFSIPANNALAADGLTIYTTYPSIAAKPGENVQTDIILSNKTDQGMTVDLEIESLPQGWEAYLEGDGRIIEKAYVAEEDVEMSLTVQIPAEVEEGKYTVIISPGYGI